MDFLILTEWWHVLPDDITLPNDITLSNDITLFSDITLSSDITLPNDITLSSDITLFSDITLSSDITLPNDITVWYSLHLISFSCYNCHGWLGAKNQLSTCPVLRYIICLKNARKWQSFQLKTEFYCHWTNSRFLFCFPECYRSFDL